MLGIIVEFFVLVASISGSVAVLPDIPGCVPLEDQTLDTIDPASIFGSNTEVGIKAPPRRVGNLRSRGALPTGHFATNEIKSQNPEPLRIFPYQAILKNDGITYDAYTMERWYDPKRTDTMQQQSATEAGKPWNKLLSMGTNLRQLVSGPDGNPTGVFTGKSGIRVGISGSGEPEMTDFGDLYATFMYRGSGGGSMEVPLVSGSVLQTHIFKNANPIITPYCLSNFNGQAVKFDCPKENSMADGGSGYLSGSCTGGVLRIQLNNSKKVKDITLIQFAASKKSEWSLNRNHPPMITCTTSTCRLVNDGNGVEIDIPNASGVMAFAGNYITRYILPWNWIAHPQEVTCSGSRKRRDLQDRSVDDISVHARCDTGRNVEIIINLASNDIPGINKIQYAIEPSDKWGNPPPMYTCTLTVCQRVGNTVVIKKTVTSDNLKFAVNIIGYTVIPRRDWIKYPYDLVCGGDEVHSQTSGPNPFTSASQPTTTTPKMTTTTQHNTATTKSPCEAQTTTTQSTVKSTTGSQTTVRPTTGSQTTSATVKPTRGTKFMMEMDEPGTELPNQTRKFLVYFSEPVTPNVNTGDNTISFTPNSGGTYSGIMQVAYLGAGQRGDHSNDTLLDQYLGVYPYKPKTSYCVWESTNKALLRFDWNPNDDHALSDEGRLLMVALPHHELLLRKLNDGNLKKTVYGFSGYEGHHWTLAMDLPRAPLEPDNNAVNKIKSNQQQNQDIINAIDRDARGIILDNICAYSDSYGVGKEIGFVSRLASISRAFGTQHYVQLDDSIKRCLEKWLRINDVLSNKLKFQYDTVWGGMFLRGTDGDLAYYTDFGFPYYNDHHFHLGYFLYAIAYYAKHHSSWANMHKHRIYALARDVGNPSNKDKFFPVARQKDMYLGFSWATGIVPGIRQEESSSEALNCYHALAALGDAYNDDVLKHTGQVLLAMEITSVREYWHVRDHNENNFPPFLQDFGAVGMINEGNFYVYTLNWGCDPNVFPMRHGSLVGIQVIPITAVSKYWMDRDWAKHILKTCTMAIDPSSAADYSKANPDDLKQLNSGWKAFCYAAMAPYDDAHAKMAADFVRDKGPRQLVSGTGAASTLLFIYGNT